MYFNIPLNFFESSCEEMAAYLDAGIEEADGDAAFIAKALGDIARARGVSQIAEIQGFPGKACIDPWTASTFPVSIRSLR